MQRLQDLSQLFLRIAEELEQASKEAGEELMVAAESKFWRRAAEIIQAELEPETNDAELTFN